jgi:hypothetical protein
MAALCASISRLLARCSGTLEKLSASEPNSDAGLVVAIDEYVTHHNHDLT